MLLPELFRFFINAVDVNESLMSTISLVVISRFGLLYIKKAIPCLQPPKIENINYFLKIIIF